MGSLLKGLFGAFFVARNKYTKGDSTMIEFLAIMTAPMLLLIVGIICAKMKLC